MRRQTVRTLRRPSGRRRGAGAAFLVILALLLFHAVPGPSAAAVREPGAGEAAARDVGPDEALRLFRQANSLYAEGSYGAAAEVYQTIIDGGFRSAEVYYNLANARYKEGNLGQAVLGYERALRLDGSNRDAVDNLEFVREQLADRQVPVGGALATALERFARRAATGRLAVLVSALYFATVGFIVAGVLRGAFRPWMLRVVAVLAVALLGAGLLLGYRVHRDAAVREAVITSAEVPVRTGPGDDFVLEFKLHEGTKVRMREARDEWVRVSVEGTDLEGWLPEGAVEEI